MEVSTKEKQRQAIDMEKEFSLLAGAAFSKPTKDYFLMMILKVKGN